MPPIKPTTINQIEMCNRLKDGTCMDFRTAPSIAHEYCNSLFATFIWISEFTNFVTHSKIHCRISNKRAKRQWQRVSVRRRNCRIVLLYPSLFCMQKMKYLKWLTGAVRVRPYSAHTYRPVSGCDATLFVHRCAAIYSTCGGTHICVRHICRYGMSSTCSFQVKMLETLITGTFCRCELHKWWLVGLLGGCRSINAEKWTNYILTHFNNICIQRTREFMQCLRANDGERQRQAHDAL